MKAMLVFAGLATASLGQATPLEETTPGEVGMDPVKLMAAREHALTGGGSGIIMRGGKVVLRWGDQKQRYDLKSSTKSIGITALGLAIGDGKLGLDDLATDRHPQFGTPPDANAETGWLGTITLRHLATQTAGFEKPGGYEPLVSEPGTKWSYSDGGPNWLAECVTLAYGRDLDELMFERVFGPIGITRDDLMWRNNAYRDHEIEGIKRREFGSGIHANVEAMARVGMLYLRGGEWDGEQIIPRSFVDACRTTVDGVVGLPEQDPDTYGNASDHYGLLWWNNADGTLADAPRDAYWSWGLYESLIVVIPSLDVVAARAGKSWQRDGWGGHYGVLEPFIGAIAQSVAAENAAPYPMSQVIVGMTWAPESEIIRLAEGSDLTIIATGSEVRAALDAAELLREDGISARVVDMHTIKPLDAEEVRSAAAETGAVLTVEEHNVIGGLGSAVAEVLVECARVPFLRHGVRDEFALIGPPGALYAHYKLDGPGVREVALDLLRGEEA